MLSKTRKVFGIISYFPDATSDYHSYVRKRRISACTTLLQQLGKLWPNIDILIIAQNWRDYKPPIINNKITVYNYDRLGALNARKELRQKFLESEYENLIMLDDDVVIDCKDSALFIEEIDKHPDSFGVYRRKNHPLSLAVISKYLYDKNTLIDIDIEKGEGFGDALFVAKCFAQFPDNCYELTSIRELSLLTKYACPSTWMGDTQLDLDHMVSITEALMLSVTSRDYNEDNISIDIVIPYVDSEDQIWRSDYEKHINTGLKANRFRSWDLLRYLFRGIARYMSFIRNVILVVACDSQVPQWVDRDLVKIVYHKDFIPEQFLPTFNSCTIECFLYNIPDLSEYFIYFNDDIFPINPMKSSDFFSDRKPHLKFREHEIDDIGIFCNQRRNSLDAVTQILDLSKYPEGEILVPEHSAFPILKSCAHKVGEACKEIIENSISNLRESKNINQYIYHYYQYFTKNYVNEFCPYIYMEVDNISRLREVINVDKIKLVCLNDRDAVKDYENIQRSLAEIFECKFPTSCRYERS